MLPQHIKDELAKLSQAQVMKFHELVAWASNSGIPEVGVLPVDYYKILEMVHRMGPEPVEPVAPIVPDDPEFTFKDYFKNPNGK